MNEAAIKKRLEELESALTTIPGEAGKVKQDDICIHLGTGEQASVEEVLDHLRLEVKYLLFDLEATKRENGYLRRMLETRQKPSDDNDNGPPKW
jgi:hypothetical protein